MGSFTEYLQSNQPAVQAALDTLMLVQLGTTYNDPRFLYESRRRYGEALGSLSRLLVQPKTAYIEDALAAVYLLGNCEVGLSIIRAGYFFGSVNTVLIFGDSFMRTCTRRVAGMLTSPACRACLSSEDLSLSIRSTN